MGFPHGNRKTTILVAGLRMTGMVAPMVLDGPINGDWFEAYVRQVLVPELPAPYSPDFNPIEKAFSRLKAMLRRASERTVSGLWDLIGRLVDIFKPRNAQTTSAPAATIHNERKPL